jgi:hypothetical protein
MQEPGGSFWKKIEQAKEDGITEEEFSRIEELEGAIVGLEIKIDECKEEIKFIKKQAKKRKTKEQSFKNKLVKSAK